MNYNELFFSFCCSIFLLLIFVPLSSLNSLFRLIYLVFRAHAIQWRVLHSSFFLNAINKTSGSRLVSSYILKRSFRKKKKNEKKNLLLLLIECWLVVCVFFSYSKIQTFKYSSYFSIQNRFFLWFRFWMDFFLLIHLFVSNFQNWIVKVEFTWFVRSVKNMCMGLLVYTAQHSPKNSKAFFARARTIQWNDQYTDMHRNVSLVLIQNIVWMKENEICLRREIRIVFWWMVISVWEECQWPILLRWKNEHRREFRN